MQHYIGVGARKRQIRHSPASGEQRIAKGPIGCGRYLDSKYQGKLKAPDASCVRLRQHLMLSPWLPINRPEYIVFGRKARRVVSI